MADPTPAWKPDHETVAKRRAERKAERQAQKLNGRVDRKATNTWLILAGMKPSKRVTAKTEEDAGGSTG